MGMLDIGIILLFLIFGINGLRKGFLNRLVKSFSFLGALILDFFLVKRVVNFVSGTKIYSKIGERVVEFLGSKGDVFSKPLVSASSEAIEEALNATGIPGFIQKIISNNIVVTDSAQTLGEYLSPMITNLVVNVGTYLVLGLALYVVLKLLAKLFKNVNKIPVLGTVNRILGLIWELLKATLFICVVMMILTSLTNIEVVNNFLISDMKLNEEGFGIAKYFYSENPLLKIISNIDLKEILSSMINPIEEQDLWKIFMR